MVLYRRIRNIIQKHLDHGRTRLLKSWLHQARTLILSPQHRGRRDLDSQQAHGEQQAPRLRRSIHCKLGALHYTYPRPLLVVETRSTGFPLDVRTINVVPFAEKHRSHHAPRFVPVLFPSGRQDPGKEVEGSASVSVYIKTDLYRRVCSMLDEYFDY